MKSGWLYGGIIGVVLALVLCGQTRGSGSSGQTSPPRGRGFCDRKMIELVLSRIEQDLNAGRRGGVKARLDAALMSSYGGTYDEAMSVIDAYVEARAKHEILDLQPVSICIEDGQAIVNLRVVRATKVRGGGIKRIVDKEVRVILLKGLGAWRIYEGDTFLDSLCGGSSSLIWAQDLRWVDVVRPDQCDVTPRVGGGR